MGWQDAPVIEESTATPAWMSAPIVGDEEAPVGPMQKEPPKEKSDWEMAKESLGKMVEPAAGTEPGTWEYYKSMGREAFLESNPLVNLGAWAIKKATGQETEGDLQKFPAKPEPGFVESLKEGVKFMAEHPLTATAELAKGLLYSPELSVLAFSKGPEMAARAAEMAKLGRAARAVAVTGESALEGGAAMGGISAVQQAAQKESVNWGEVGAQATIGAALVPALRGLSAGLEAGGRWARGGKVEAPETPMPDRFADWVEAGGEIRSPGEQIYRQPDVFRDLPRDEQLNAAARADRMMQEGASKKAADVATNKNPELAAAMEAIRERRAGAKESFGRGVLQGEVLEPEAPRGPVELGVTPAGTDMVPGEMQARANFENQRRLQNGEADPRLLAALGLTAGAGILAATYPEEAKKYAGEFALGGALLATTGKLPQPLRTLGGELAQGRYTLKTLERLPQNRTEIPKTMIEQQLRRNDVPKVERDVLEGILKTKGEQVPAAELVRDFRLATGDHTLEAKAESLYADYGLERISRNSPDNQWRNGVEPVEPTTTLYRLPEHMEMSDANHFRDPRLFGWTRSFEEGGVKHVVEVQSDLAQHAKVLSPEETAKRMEAYTKAVEEADRLSDGVTRSRATGVGGNDLELARKVLEENGFKPRGDASDFRYLTEVAGQARLREQEAYSATKGIAEGSQLGPMLKHWPRRLIREELGKGAAEGRDVVRFADADTVAKVEGWQNNSARIERLYQDKQDIESRIQSVDRYWSKEDQPKRLVELNKTLDQINKDIAEYKPGFTDPGHQSIYDRYKTDIESYLKSLGGKHVTDASGHGWYEVPTKSQAGRINQYGKADPKLLGGIALVGAGMLAGGLLAGDSKVAGAILGGIAGAGLMRLPRTLAGLGKTLSWKQATWNAARVGAVLGAGTYIGGKTGDPVYGAAVASAIILGKAALKPARKLSTDQFISIRNGNIASQQRIVDNMVRDINRAIPDQGRRVAVSEALDRGSPEGLAPRERQVYGYVRQFLDNIGKEATDAEVIKGMRANYISYIVERDPAMTLEQESGILRRIFESSEGGASGSPNTRFGKRGKYETFDEINAALKGSGLRLKTQDVGEIVGLYAKSMRTAIENKILLDNLKKAKSTSGDAYIVRQDKNNNVPQGYEKLNHPQMMGYGVHPDLVDSLKVVLNNSDPNVVTRGLHGLAMAVKRVQVFGSLFHAKSLGEVYLNAMGKDFYSIKTGINIEPIRAALRAYEKGGLGDTLDLGIKNGLSMQIPLDVSQSIIGDIGKAVNNLTPRLVGKELKIGTAVTDKIDWVNGKLDKLTWDTMHAGIKGAVFLKEFETLMLRNAEAHAANPKKVPLKSREQIAREVATYANDLTGGLNWFNIAADAKTQLGRQLGMYFAGPEGQRFAQMLAFAPDWAVSTLRAGFRAFGESDHTLRGLWKPGNATDLYRRYALRSTLYWITLLNGINFALSGHSIFENKDPTRLQFADGTSMQAGKHTFEAVHAVTDPVRFAYNKLGFAPKMLVDRMSGKSGYGDTAPKFETFAGHAAQAALPFTVNTAMQPGLTPAQRVTRPLASAVGFPVYGTSPEQKAQIKIERAAAQEQRRQTRKDWGGKE